MRIFIILNWIGFKQNHSIILFTQMVYPPATARHERAGRMMIFFFHQFSPQKASRRLSFAALLRARNSRTMASPLSALHMKASDSCKIQVNKVIL